MSVSPDGYVEGRHHEIDWHLADREFNAYALKTLDATETLIIGRTTYELMAAYWPRAHDNDPLMKEKLNARPKLVFSRRLASAAWQNSRLAVGSVRDEVAHPKQGPGDGLP